MARWKLVLRKFYIKLKKWIWNLLNDKWIILQRIMEKWKIKWIWNIYLERWKTILRIMER